MSCETRCADCPVIKGLNKEISEQERVKDFFPDNPIIDRLQKEKRQLLAHCDPIMAEAAEIVRKNRPVECQSTVSPRATVFVSPHADDSRSLRI